MIKKFTSNGLGLLFLIFPLLVSAQTPISVQAQIDALLNQISQLQAQITALRAQSSDSAEDSSRCVYLERPLVIGSTDATTNGEVSKLQQFLVAEGVYPEARITGYYGILTARAVVRWQKAHGMDFVTTASGIGPMTRAKLREQCGQPLVISGEYEYSDMAGFSTFRTANGPFGAPASIVIKTKQWKDIPAGSMTGFYLHDAIVGTLNQVGDMCGLVIEVTVEIANPEKTGERDRQGNEVVRADFVRLVSKGRVFDDCTNIDGDGTSTRTERKISSLPLICTDQSGVAPVITSISPVSGPIGTKVLIEGCNLAGFENDFDVVFARSDGAKIPLYGGTGVGQKKRAVTVQSYCPSGSETGRYSGIVSPCITVQAVPGVYKVYVTAWGKKSNEAQFTITEDLTKETVLRLLGDVLFDSECRSEGVVGKYASCMIDMVKTDGNWTVTVTFYGLYDDSVKANRTRTLVVYQNGLWNKQGVSQTQQCRPGRGHQDFSVEVCL